ncbi:replication initiation protein [Azotobacter armeniacus]
MQEAQVYKSNAIIEASYRLSVAEQRIMLACMAQVRRDQPLSADVFYSVSVADIAVLSGSTSGTLYSDLERAALKLKRREVWIRDFPNGGSREEILITGWVDSIRYARSEGRVRLRFHRDMLPYLSELTEQFTRYALSDVAKMTSSHAIRLFELLAQFGSVGSREVSVEQLRAWFQLEDSYPLMADLRRWVIEPAVAQVNEHSPLAVKWEQRKTGRKVTHLVFTFGQKKAKTPAKSASKPTAMAFEKFLQKHARPGESDFEARQRLMPLWKEQAA